MSEEIVDTTDLGEQIVAVLKTIFDPEIPVDIYELGLIYDVLIKRILDVKIIMTLTSPNCPVVESLNKEKVRSIDIVNDVEIELTFEPTWTQDMMSWK